MRFVAHVQYLLTGFLLGLMLVAPSPLWADPTPATDRQEQQGLRWPVQGKVTSRFGPRGLFHLHRGVDIKAPKGTPVHAAAAGTVAFSGRQSSYGRVIKIDHPNGFRTVYAHNSSNFVRAGQHVNAGAVIGAVGQTGHATTNHLHFEVRGRRESLRARAYGMRRSSAPKTIRARMKAQSGTAIARRRSLIVVTRRTCTPAEARAHVPLDRRRVLVQELAHPRPRRGQGGARLPVADQLAAREEPGQLLGDRQRMRLVVARQDEARCRAR